MNKQLLYSIGIIVSVITSYSMLTNTENTSVAKVFKAVNCPEQITAGSSLNLTFSVPSNTSVLLRTTNSYGDLIVFPIRDGQHSVFKIPETHYTKSGQLGWTLLSDNTIVLSGKVQINPKSKINAVESYIGPPSIEAGGTDYTMFTVIPSDDLDNPLADGTLVKIKHQFKDISVVNDVYTRYGYTFKNIRSYRPDGRIIMSAESLGLNSKEFDVNVMPAVPTDFNISYERVHDFADGNQITTFKTDIIRDRFDNIVSDGTSVSFYITNKFGHRSITAGTTIRGIAHANIIHPDFEDQWTVKAYVEGMAESETIALSYQKAISNIKVKFSEDYRKITIGPVKSFMNQRVPEGLQVTLKVFKNNNLDERIIQETTNGYTTFTLKKDRFPEGLYNFEIYAAGTTQTFTGIQLSNE